MILISQHCYCCFVVITIINCIATTLFFSVWDTWVRSLYLPCELGLLFGSIYCTNRRVHRGPLRRNFWHSIILSDEADPVARREKRHRAITIFHAIHGVVCRIQYNVLVTSGFLTLPYLLSLFRLRLLGPCLSHLHPLPHLSLSSNPLFYIHMHAPRHQSPTWCLGYYSFM